MKKFTPTLLGLFVASAAFGQQQENTLPAQLEVANPETQVRATPSSDYRNASETVLWSEDFANGIPATWSNQGFDGNLQPLTAAQWEYRGTSTTPDNSEGSRGAYSGVSTGANAPIASTTAANGFVIFDSDYLDNGGNPQNPGGGSAPAPHVGTLTTDVINLTGEPYVMLEMENYARVFFASLDVALSIDGGTTWTDTVNIYSEDGSSLGVNGSSPNGELVQVNLSTQIGGQSNVKLRFIFDGRPGNANGNGYYYWMIDDIRISELPRHAIRFTPFNGAPERDVIFGTAAGESKHGIVTLKQARSVAFDCNVLNFGWDQQTNVGLDINIYDSGSNLVQTLSSSTATAASGAIVDYTVLNTLGWTPSAEDNYIVEWVATSDSIPSAVGPKDSARLYVTDSIWSLDFNVFSNRFGTGNIGDDNSAVASRFDLVNDERLFGADIWLSATTVPGGLIEVTVYDTTGFDFVNGFPTQPLAYYQHSITQADVDAGVIRADLTDNNGYPAYLSSTNTGAYYIVVTMFSNAGANPVYIRNDQSFPQPSTSAIMYYTLASPRWYTGFSNSLSLNAPHIRAITCPAATAAACMSVSIDEVELSDQITVYPNPAEDFVNLEFGEGLNGDVDVNIVDLQGRTVVSTSMYAVEGTALPVALNELTPGVYMMNISQGDKVSTFKLTVK